MGGTEFRGLIRTKKKVILEKCEEDGGRKKLVLVRWKELTTSSSTFCCLAMDSLFRSRVPNGIIKTSDTASTSTCQRLNR
jgi:hypothetical protein